MMFALGPFVIAFLIAAFTMPVIIRVADLKQLMDEPDQDRKIHSTKTPNLGGIAIFAGTLFAYSCFTDYKHISGVQFMIPGLLLLFFAGVKDDILLLSPVKKLAFQVVCAVLITFLGKLRLTSFWGMFGLEEISAPLGGFCTVFLIVALINAYNLIDGVNGLAGGLGLIASLFFGTWFLLTESPAQAILAFSLGGALLGFLLFNFNNAKIFMGDTGSMTVGFIVSILSIKFVENNRLPGFDTSEWYVRAAPGVALAVLMIPLFDMTRLFFLRLLRRQSPFKADRNHLHHILLDLGFTHSTVALVLYVANIILIALALFLRTMRSLELTAILVVLCSALVTFAFWLKGRKKILETQKAPVSKASV